MPPGGHSLPESLLPGNGELHNSRSALDANYDGSPLSPVSPSDLDLQFMRSGDGKSGDGKSGDGNPPANSGAPAGDVSPDAEGRVGRKEERDHGEPQDPSSQRDQSVHRERSTHRDRSHQNGRSRTKSPNNTPRICKKCGEALTGQFVRALGTTYHLECFKCEDCGQIVASKFFPVDAEDGSGQYPLCETDYFRRLDLICYECGGALRSSYITALDRKYHIEHFTCSVCPTVFGAQDSYYEHEGKVYCHYHYSTQFAQRCHGCHTSILKQFVEIFRNGQNQHWHPECYMIHKFWNVRLAPTGQPLERPQVGLEATDEERERVRKEEDQMEEKVYKIWRILSTFEESSATCISDMLLNVSNGAYMDGVVVAKRFIGHVDVLFLAIDGLAALMKDQGMKDLAYGREAKLLCKKIVAFFSLLSKTQETGVRKLGVTQELLSLVTGLAHYLKLLIRIGLQGTLKLEREKNKSEGLQQFLEYLGDLSSLKPPEDNTSPTDLFAGVAGLADQQSDCCTACKDPIDDECVILGERRWHLKPPHLMCAACQKDLTTDLADGRWSEKDGRPFCSSCAIQKGHAPDAQGGFEHVSKLRQYVYLLKVALARLLSVLRSGGTIPHNSDEHGANDSHKNPQTGESKSVPQRSNTRATTYARGSTDESSSLEQTVGEMRRLRSTRTGRTLSTTYKKARASRIIDGPEGRSARPGSSGGDGPETRKEGFQIVEEKDANGETHTELTFGNQDALTLDDIPRIIAAEQAKELRPNASKYAPRRDDHPAKYAVGHQRGMSSANGPQPADPPPARTKRYFSELSALEYFIVRHVAVLSMEPLLEGYFNLEELLSLIESRKPTIWNIFGRAFNKDGKKVGKKKGVFGVSLDYLVERDGAESTHGVGPGALRIPALVDDAVSAMRQMDMSVEGIFRKNGNIKRLKDLADLIDTKYEAVDLNKESPVQIAALLKKFLREMPDPLLTFKLHRLFVISQKVSDPEKQKRILHLACCLLPKAHRDTMEVLFAFLNWTSTFSHIDEETGSKMDIRNLATVMTPNILYSNTKSSGVDESFLAIEAVCALITYNDTMCEIPEDLQYILADTSFFKDNPEITTKDILKRYGDLGRGSVAQKLASSGDPPPRATTSRGNAAVAARVDSDPSQDAAAQLQSSARPSGAAPPSKTAPPQTGMEHAPPQPPQPALHRDRSVISRPLPQPDGQQQQQHQQQQHVPYRPRPGPGAMDVAG